MTRERFREIDEILKEKLWDGTGEGAGVDVMLLEKIDGIPVEAFDMTAHPTQTEEVIADFLCNKEKLTELSQRVNISKEEIGEWINMHYSK